MDTVCLDFRKAFDIASQIGKILVYGLYQQTVRWIENWLKGQAQRVVISGTKSSWRPVTSGVSQGSTLGPILFNIFTNDLDGGAEHTLSKFTDNAKLGGVADTPEDCAAIQRDLARLKKWANTNIMQINKGKCKVLYLWRNNPMHQYMLGAPSLKAALQKWPWGSWWTPS